jgi:hypothetical protein
MVNSGGTELQASCTLWEPGEFNQAPPHYWTDNLCVKEQSYRNGGDGNLRDTHEMLRKIKQRKGDANLYSHLRI